MRKRFEQQLGLGQLPIEDALINPKSKNALDELLAALKAIYCEEYNEKIFSILEKHTNSGKKNTGGGRHGFMVHFCFITSSFVPKPQL